MRLSRHDSAAPCCRPTRAPTSRSSRARAAWLIADDGRRYLDFAGGIAVVALGHGHPAPLAAAHEQLDRLWHVSNLYWTEPMTQARRAAVRALRRRCRPSSATPGAEANEAAIKYARKATGRPGIVALEGSFHGRTTRRARRRPASRRSARRSSRSLPGVTFAQLNDVASLEAAVGPDTGLILIEPVQGEGGVLPADSRLPRRRGRARRRARRAALLRRGADRRRPHRHASSPSSSSASGPHLVTLAKGLANGLPIGALLVGDGAPAGLEPGDHASTFGGNPVACAAACAVVETVDDELLANVRERSAQLAEALPVRGLGPAARTRDRRRAGAVVRRCLDAGLLVTSAGPTSLRLTPPLTVTPEEVAQAISILQEVLP